MGIALTSLLPFAHLNIFLPPSLLSDIALARPGFFPSPDIIAKTNPHPSPQFLGAKAFAPSAASLLLAGELVSVNRGNPEKGAATAMAGITLAGGSDLLAGVVMMSVASDEKGGPSDKDSEGPKKMTDGQMADHDTFFRDLLEHLKSEPTTRLNMWRRQRLSLPNSLIDLPSEKLAELYAAAVEWGVKKSEVLDFIFDAIDRLGVEQQTRTLHSIATHSNLHVRAAVVESSGALAIESHPIGEVLGLQHLWQIQRDLWIRDIHSTDPTTIGVAQDAIFKFASEVPEAKKLLMEDIVPRLQRGSKGDQALALHYLGTSKAWRDFP